MGNVATSPLPYRGSPPLQCGGTKSEVAHKWAMWLPHPCRIGYPHRFRAGDKIRSGPQVGNVATSPLPYRGSPPLQCGGTKSEVAHKWAMWLPHPCRIGDPHRFRAGDKIRSGPQVGNVATSPLPYRGSPPLQCGGTKSEVAHKWAMWLPHPCRIGDPHRFIRGIKSEAAHKWAMWLPHPRRIGDPHRFSAGGQNQKWPTSGQCGYLTRAVSGIPTASKREDKIRSGPQVGNVATSPLPFRGSPPLHSGGQNQKWPTSGQCGYLTPAVSGIPSAAERGAKSEVAHKWAIWLPHPCRMAAPSLQSGGQNQKWPTSGRIGYLTPAVSGIPTASKRGIKSEAAHKWAMWLPHPCRIGDPHRFSAGGQNQKWPTSGQCGYLTPAVSGIPTASERGIE